MHLRNLALPAILALLTTLGLDVHSARADAPPAAVLVNASEPLHEARPIRVALFTHWYPTTPSTVVPGVMVTARVLPHVDLEAAVHATITGIFVPMADAGIRIRTGEQSTVGFLFARAGAAAPAISCSGCDDSVTPFGTVGLGVERASRGGWSIAAQSGVISELSDWDPDLDVQVSAGWRF